MSTPKARPTQAPAADWEPDNRLRFVTAASLFDGHDASINIMRRVLQSQGAEVIHLGHDRCVTDVVDAAVEEDAHAIAVSSYQGGHNEYFGYLVDLLAERGRSDILVFGGGCVSCGSFGRRPARTWRCWGSTERAPCPATCPWEATCRRSSCRATRGP